MLEARETGARTVWVFAGHSVRPRFANSLNPSAANFVERCSFQGFVWYTDCGIPAGSVG